MLKLLNKRKKDNKGFTLVELVIVIAILAILVGLLAPQYTKYVEKSRKSADVNNMEELVKAVEVYVIDSATKDKVPAQTTAVTLKLDADGVTVGGKKPTASDSPMFYNAFNEYVKNWNTVVLKGKHWKDDAISVDVAFDENGGVTLSNYTPNEYAAYAKTGDSGSDAGK